MEFDELKQLVESNAKSIEALSNESAAARQELREGLRETKAIVDSSAKAILALAEQSTGDRQNLINLGREVRELKESSIVQRDVANALLKIASDHEKRLTQLVGYSITGESDRLDLLERLQKLEQQVKQLTEGNK